MNTTLTLDQRVNRGIKKIKEHVPEKELTVYTISLQRHYDDLNLGIGNQNEVKQISIVMQEINQNKGIYAVLETDVAGVFGTVTIDSMDLVFTISEYQQLWPLPYKIEEYMQEYFSISDTRIRTMSLSNDTYDQYTFNATRNAMNFYWEVRSIDGKIHAINLQTKKIAKEGKGEL